MTRYEKVIIALFGLALLWRFFPTPGQITAEFLLSWLLAGSYLAGGYWLFRRRPAPPAWVRVVAGLCLGAALLVVVPALDLPSEKELLFLLLPGASIGLVLGLGALLVRLRHRRGRYAYSPLLWRALVVALVSGFLAYGSIWFRPYREVLLLANRARPHERANLLMFDYYQRFERALATHDTSAASAYLAQSVSNGKRWLGPDSSTYAFRYSGVLTEAYDAYRTAGDTLYAHDDFAAALSLYRAAYRCLLAADTRHALAGKPSAYWAEEQVLALENIGLSLRALHRYPASDSTFLQAVRQAKGFKPKPWHSRLLSEWAWSLSKESQYEAANYLYRVANRRLTSDTTRDAQAQRVSNALAMSFNLLNQDSTTAARRQLSRLPPLPPGSAAERKAWLYESIACYKLAQFAEARRLLLHLKQAAARTAAPPSTELLAARLLLADVELAQGRYEPARAEALAAGAALRSLPHAGPNPDFAALLTLGAIEEATGHYQVASQRYAYLLALPPSPNQKQNLRNVLAQAAVLELTLDQLPAAQAHLAAALAEVQVTTPGAAGLLNTAAYSDYLQGKEAAAVVRYRQVLATNRRYGLPANPATAAAYNGLGLVALDRRQLPAADSLLHQSIVQHEATYGIRHPLTALAYLNYGMLQLQTHELATADALFAKAHTIAQEFLPADHDFFGDLNLALGDLAYQRKQAAQAQIYYAHALAIYTAKFGLAHRKTKLAQRTVSRL